MSALLYPSTINSDDEIENEEDNDSVEEYLKDRKQSKTSKRKQKKSSFSFDFDDGQIYRNRVDISDDDDDDKDESGDSDKDDDLKKSNMIIKNNDTIRAMPHAEDRIVRAATKKLKKNENLVISKKDEINTTEDPITNYFESTVTGGSSSSNALSNGNNNILFSQLSLSRPLLRAIERTGYVNATPIQCQTIPYALAGKDICASAETGSGKTAAFVLPFLERLLYRPRDIASIRVLVITPTRELATQIHDVLEKLAQFTDITSVLICGGKKDTRSQEVLLRQRPDVVICTPGRMLDHLRNSPSVNLDELDVLVLDEADRLLDLGFQEEVEELVKYTPIARQTMLFSATMSAKVEDLVKMSLKRPIRVKITGNNINGTDDSVSFAPRLIQEFIKVRSTTSGTSAVDTPGTSGADQEVVESMLLALISRSFNKQCIVFFEMKRNAHRFCALLNVFNIKAAELHGDVTQVQRYQALEKFRNQQVDILVATDVAARGLDIPGVQTVINAEMPRNLSIYVHRVGRTARAGCGGRAITLVSDSRRKMMKDVLKLKGDSVGDIATKELQVETNTTATTKDNIMNNDSNNNIKNIIAMKTGQVLSRTIPNAILVQYAEKIKNSNKLLIEYFQMEKMKAQIDTLQMEADRAENLLVHEDEIVARPARTWYQTEREKKELREISREKVKDEQEEALLGKEQALLKKSAKERAAALALSDDYPLDDIKNKAHKMSRKKRRRLEALKDSQSSDIDDQNDKQKNNAIQSAPKRAKIALRKKVETQKEITLSEITMKKVIVNKLIKSTNNNENNDNNNENNSNKKIKLQHSKVLRQSFAIGGLDQEYIDWGMGASGVNQDNRMTKAQIKQAAREKPFTEYDPSMKLRKGGKVGNKSFKSKAKFKRRK